MQAPQAEMVSRVQAVQEQQGAVRVSRAQQVEVAAHWEDFVSKQGGEEAHHCKQGLLEVQAQQVEMESLELVPEQLLAQAAQERAVGESLEKVAEELLEQVAQGPQVVQVVVQEWMESLVEGVDQCNLVEAH